MYVCMYVYNYYINGVGRRHGGGDRRGPCYELEIRFVPFQLPTRTSVWIVRCT